MSFYFDHSCERHTHTHTRTKLLRKWVIKEKAKLFCHFAIFPFPPLGRRRRILLETCSQSKYTQFEWTGHARTPASLENWSKLEKNLAHSTYYNLKGQLQLQLLWYSLRYSERESERSVRISWCCLHLPPLPDLVWLQVLFLTSVTSRWYILKKSTSRDEGEETRKKEK